MATGYIVGQTVINEIEFRSEGVLRDPTIVRCLVRAPSGAVEELVHPSSRLVRRGVGRYDASVITDAPGTWVFRAVGVGVVDAVQEASVNVAPSLIG